VVTNVVLFAFARQCYDKYSNACADSYLCCTCPPEVLIAIGMVGVRQHLLILKTFGKWKELSESIAPKNSNHFFVSHLREPVPFLRENFLRVSTDAFWKLKLSE
jgi:hypothetical protein